MTGGSHRKKKKKKKKNYLRPLGKWQFNNLKKFSGRFFFDCGSYMVGLSIRFIRDVSYGTSATWFHLRSSDFLASFSKQDFVDELMV